KSIKQSGVSELFEKYGVDLYFAGHAHRYWRDPPVQAGKATSNETRVYKVRRIREKRARVSLSVDDSWKALSLEACPDPNKKNRVWVFAAELLEETGYSNKQPYVNVLYGPNQSKTLITKLQWMQNRCSPA
ncbi:unnamed protein product, partial [Symbiodinium sp. KB8]